MSEEKITYKTDVEAAAEPMEEKVNDPDKSQNERVVITQDIKQGYTNYVYRGRCVRVVDGDTYDILCDLGFGVYHKIRVRLRGVDTPEKYGKNACEEGRQVSELVNDILFDKEVMVRTYKGERKSFDRWVADVFFNDENGFLINLAKFLTANGHGEAVEGYTL